jgi:hypothetical protein
MNSVFLLHILTILLHFLIEFISGGGRIYNQKVKITVKDICEAIYNYK